MTDNKDKNMMTEKELMEFWNYNEKNRPFVVNFLYAWSFPKRPNLDALIKLEVIPSVTDVPRGFRKITHEQFTNLANFAYRK